MNDDDRSGEMEDDPRSGERIMAGIEALTALRAEFDRCVVASEHRRRRKRLLATTAATLVLVPAAVAGAVQVAGGGSEPVVVSPGERVLVGFLDPATGEELTCPDGSRLTKWVGTAESGARPRCPDGTTPDEYTRLADKYRAEWDRFFEEAPALTPLSEGPGFMTFELDRETSPSP